MYFGTRCYQILLIASVFALTKFGYSEGVPTPVPEGNCTAKGIISDLDADSFVLKEIGTAKEYNCRIIVKGRRYDPYQDMPEPSIIVINGKPKPSVIEINGEAKGLSDVKNGMHAEVIYYCDRHHEPYAAWVKQLKVTTR